MTEPTPLALPPGTPACHRCGGEVLSWRDDEPAVCPDCCDDHDYLYERADRTHYCKHCGQEPPEDWYDVDELFNEY